MTSLCISSCCCALYFFLTLLSLNFLSLGCYLFLPPHTTPFLFSICMCSHAIPLYFLSSTFNNAMCYSPILSLFLSLFTHTPLYVFSFYSCILLSLCILLSIPTCSPLSCALLLLHIIIGIPRKSDPSISIIQSFHIL